MTDIPAGPPYRCRVPLCKFEAAVLEDLTAHMAGELAAVQKALVQAAPDSPEGRRIRARHRFANGDPVLRRVVDADDTGQPGDATR